MFTGIVEELGKLKEKRKGGQSYQLDLEAALVLNDVKLGDSIAVNGVCLTVVAFDPGRFTVDVMPETLKKTSLDQLRPGNFVNLERALRLGDRMGGHLVQGHVDGVGRLVEQSRVDNALVTRINCSPELMRYILPRGSVALDGVSLTVVEVWGDGFSVSLIPHTAKLTTLGWKSSGSPVNIETDILGKYIEHLMNQSRPGPRRGVDLDFLRENGFTV